MSESKVASLPDELQWGKETNIETAHGPLWGIDTAIAPLVIALNRIPQLRTTSSCSGHAHLRASILFRAADLDNDALMESAFVRALAVSRTSDGEFAHARSVVRRLSGAAFALQSADDFELEFWGWGEGMDERVAHWYAERDAIIGLCDQYAVARRHE